jgi:O-acetyl-ADP-ribose deacetylase (regulator of RNase III)/ADP-ribose pyrophosphatase YjhB (NUDIX family)
MKIKDIELKVIKGDLTEAKVDAIVNAANNKLEMGGGVAGAIRKKGGTIIEDEAMKKGPIKIGGATATGAGKLKSKYVIHAATMGMDFKTDEGKIRSSMNSSLALADKLKIKSLAFPALGCGVGGFSYIAAAKIMAQEVLRYTRDYEKPSLKEIQFVLFSDDAYEAFEKNVLGYLNYVQDKLSAGPYSTVDIIIEIDGGIVLIKRKNPPFGWAIPGGFVDYGESLEDCAAREAKEETGLDIYDLKQMHTYSDPKRDPRFHTICTVFTAKAKGTPKGADDALEAKVFKLDKLPQEFAFDHSDILEDYKQWKKQQ